MLSRAKMRGTPREIGSLGARLACPHPRFARGEEANDGLVALSSKVFYKVYVVLTTGNEKGSRTVSVTRP